MVPRSLFGRLLLVLCGGLILAQLLSAYINYAERDRLLFRASGIRSAQRIADIVNVLDPLGNEERRRIVGILTGAPLFVSLEREPIAGDQPGVEDAQRAAFIAALHGTLGVDRAIRVASEGARPSWARVRERRAMMAKGPPPEAGESGEPRRRGPRGVFFLTQVALKDGTWVTFDAFVPPAAPDFAWRLIGSLAILLAAVLVLSWLAVRWVTRPLNVLATAAEGLGQDINRPPLPETGPSEVKRASQAFNRMQDRLKRLIDDRSRMLAAMSHDLKTPLTRMRLRTELLDDGTLKEKFEADLAEMESMVMQTLDYMRGIERHLVRQPLDILALIESLQSDYAEMKREVEVLEVHGTPLPPYDGDLQLLKRAITNLLDNAISYGERAVVTIEDSPARLILRIADRGPGVPESELERVFEPFHRLEASRNRATGGTGLGLAIARAVAQAHGGDITLHNRSEGGLEATLTLPRASSLAGPLGG